MDGAIAVWAVVPAVDMGHIAWIWTWYQTHKDLVNGVTSAVVAVFGLWKARTPIVNFLHRSQLRWWERAGFALSTREKDKTIWPHVLSTNAFVSRDAPFLLVNFSIASAQPCDGMFKWRELSFTIPRPAPLTPIVVHLDRDHERAFRKWSAHQMVRLDVPLTKDQATAIAGAFSGCRTDLLSIQVTGLFSASIGHGDDLADHFSSTTMCFRS